MDKITCCKSMIKRLEKLHKLYSTFAIVSVITIWIACLYGVFVNSNIALVIVVMLLIIFGLLVSCKANEISSQIVKYVELLDIYEKGK